MAFPSPEPDADMQPLVLAIGDVMVDTAARAVLVADEEVSLTRKEFDLLEMLLRNTGAVVEYSDLLTHVWGSWTGATGSLRVHVAQLRRKLGVGAQRPRIMNRQGMGYLLVAPRAAAGPRRETDPGRRQTE